MRFYEIHLPWQSNDGRPYTGAIDAFEALVTQKVGGCNLTRDTRGAWFSDKSGRVVSEMIVVCRFATDDRSAVVAIVTAHQRIFPDQEAVFLAEIGNAWIIPQSTEAAIKAYWDARL